MARIDFKSQRLFVAADLAAGADVCLDRAQSNYLLNVLRFRDRDGVLVFNGRQGEWRSVLSGAGRKAAVLHVVEPTRPQAPASPVHYCFAPLKQARLDYMVQKAVEMGAGVLQPVLTQHTQVNRVNLDRMRANVVEAAEQCGVLAIPVVREEVRFESWLEAWPREHLLVFCDEDAEPIGPIAALDTRRPAVGDGVGVLIGPEGGFSPAERAALIERPHVVRISLGPRILRADTAAVAALALIQAVLGDWQPSQ